MDKNKKKDISKLFGQMCVSNSDVEEFCENCHFFQCYDISEGRCEIHDKMTFGDSFSCEKFVHEDTLCTLCVNCKHFDTEDPDVDQETLDEYPNSTFGTCMCETGDYSMETCEGEVFWCDSFSAKEPTKN